MDHSLEGVPVTEARRHVRRNAGSAGFVAACLLLFVYMGDFVPPQVTDLFTLGDAVFNYSLRLGGILLAVVALLSIPGRPIALVADALVRVGLGVAMAFSGVAMVLGGGSVDLIYVLYVLFGGFFVAMGARNGRKSFGLMAGRPRAAGVMAAREVESEAVFPFGLRPLTTEKGGADAGALRAASLVEEPLQSAEFNVRDSRSSSAPPSAAEGFLATFADGGPPPPP